MDLRYREPGPSKLLEDADREVQGAAITSLGQIGGKQARQALRHAADSEDDVLRSLADEALQELEFASGSELLLMDLQTNEMQERDWDDLDGDEPSDDEDEWESEEDEEDGFMEE